MPVGACGSREAGASCGSEEGGDATATDSFTSGFSWYCVGFVMIAWRGFFAKDGLPGNAHERGLCRRIFLGHGTRFTLALTCNRGA